MHGAPLMSALAAERSGADLVHVLLPACHQEVAKMTSFNFQVHPFRGESLGSADIEPILELLATMDCAVLGPGIEHHNTESKKALLQIVDSASCTLVLDAAALQQETLQLTRDKTVVLTPHLGELERMGIMPESAQDAAREYGVTFLLKGTEDTVLTPNTDPERITGGNAGLTTGGTGDILAGLTAGLISQHMEPRAACILASNVIKSCADVLLEEKGFAYTAYDIIACLPRTLHNLSPAH